MDINNPTPTPGANDITNPTDGLTFSEESRAYLTEHGMSSEKAIIDALKSAEQYKGVDLSKMIAVPGEGAKPEEVMAVFDKLGRPAKPEDYGISVPYRAGRAGRICFSCSSPRFSADMLS